MMFLEGSSGSEMEFMGSGRQWGWVSLSAVLALLALGQAWGQQNEVESSDMLHLAPDIYLEGPLKVDLFSVYSNWHSGPGWRGRSRSDLLKVANYPPRPLLIAAPQEAGEYPVIVFQHGFAMQNAFYRQLLKHVASHGFIMVAPQMHISLGSDATDEICAAAAVIDWLPGGLAETLSKREATSVKPDLEKLALVGHSRGGKVVFGLATGICKTSLKFSAIVGLDPVDGMSVDRQTNPPILQFSQFALQLGIPTLIVGAGLGSVKRNFLFQACAPAGVSHDAFFYESAAPSFHFVAPAYGHMDYLDDETGGAIGLMTYLTCKNGPSREPMRRFTSGILVAFFQASLLADDSQLSATFLDPSLAPVKLNQPQSYGTLVSSLLPQIRAS